MEEDYEKIHFQGEDNATGLIDFSTEDDTLVLDATAMQQTQPLENWKEFSNFDLMGSTSIDAGKEVDIVGSNDPVDSYPDLIKSPEPERAMRKGKCNLRKSLAWDSAFFSNAGVLDPEELSSMICVSEKSEKHMLPQIVEDVSESTDSISTVESDNLTLDNLEVGFFEDIRASIQKSSVAIDKPSIKAAPKKVDPATKYKVKQKAAMEKPNMIPKALLKQNILPRMPVKAMKQESQDTKSAARIGISATSTTKASGIISRRNPISTAAIGKRASISAATQGIKSEKGASIATKGGEALKLPANNGARRVLPQPASSSKTKNELSSDSSCKSLQPVHATISPVKAARKKLGNRHAKSASDSTLKITTKTGQRDRVATGNSALSTCLVPSRNSSSLSPSSEQSSASSTSASNKSRSSFDKSCRSSDNDNFPLNLYHNSDQRFEEYENGGRALHSQQDCSTLTGTLSHPASVKPSGLRRPSPSIGFFDGMKTVRTPNGSLQHGGIPLPSPKVGSTLSRPNREIVVKPKTKKHPCTPIPERTSQFSGDKSTDSEEAARDAEIHGTNTECDDESLVVSRQEDLFAKVAAAEKEVKVCASALINQCHQKENGVSEKQVVETDKDVVGFVNNNSRDPLVDIKVAACSGNSTQENLSEPSSP